MKERKFTDEEVIRALECCTSCVTTEACKNCVIYPFLPNVTAEECMEYAMRLAIDLINRQKAEIEELKIRNERQKHTIKAYQINKTKAEAIKEFVGLLESVEEVVTSLNNGEAITAVDTFHIHRIAKEIIGEQK